MSSSDETTTGLDDLAENIEHARWLVDNHKHTETGGRRERCTICDVWWPCDKVMLAALAVQQNAENARLRERVAALTAQLQAANERTDMRDDVLTLADEVARLTKWGITVTDCREGCEHPACLILRAIAKYQRGRAALAQDDDGGRA